MFFRDRQNLENPSRRDPRRARPEKETLELVTFPHRLRGGERSRSCGTWMNAGMPPPAGVTSSQVASGNPPPNPSVAQGSVNAPAPASSLASPVPSVEGRLQARGSASVHDRYVPPQHWCGNGGRRNASWSGNGRRGNAPCKPSSSGRKRGTRGTLSLPPTRARSTCAGATPLGLRVYGKGLGLRV